MESPDPGTYYNGHYVPTQAEKTAYQNAHIDKWSTTVKYAYYGFYFMFGVLALAIVFNLHYKYVQRRRYAFVYLSMSIEFIPCPAWRTSSLPATKPSPGLPQLRRRYMLSAAGLFISVFLGLSTDLFPSSGPPEILRSLSFWLQDGSFAACSASLYLTGIGHHSVSRRPLS